ncbi:MAG TPA: ATP-binding protein [Schlesneria sp.]
MRRVLHWLPMAAGCLALIGGIVTVSGWVLDVSRLSDWDGDGIAMLPNTGLAAVLIGIALLPIVTGVRKSVLGIIVIAIAGATLLEHASGFNFGIDEMLLFGRPWGSRGTVVPGRMGIPAAVSWTLAGIAVNLLGRRKIVPLTVPVIGMMISAIAGLSLVGYLFGADILYAWPRFTAIALQTGTILLAVGIGLVSTAPDLPPVRILLADTAAGALARRGLPIVIILPLFLGLMCVRGQRNGYYDPAMAIALLVLSLIITLCAVLWWGVSTVMVREESLQRSEDRFSRFMERLPGLAWIKDVAGRYVYVNEAAERVFGVSRELLQGKTDLDIFPSDVAAQFRQNDSEALTSSKGVQIVETLKHDDGTIHHSIVSKFPIATSSHESALVGGIAIDITDRKRAEETVSSLLRISKQLNSTLSIDGLLDILAQEAISLIGAEAGVSGLLTPKGMVCSKYFRKGEVLPLEYCWPPLHGLPGWLIVHKIPYLTNDAKADTQIIQELCQQFGVWSAISTPIMTAQGEVIGFFEIHNKRDGSGFTSSDQDLLLAVSQAAAIAVQNALAYRSLQEAEASLKLADRRKDEFLAVLAHELRNPLAPLRNGLEIFKRSGGNHEMQGGVLNAMDRQVTHLVRLVDDLLDVGRISHDKLELRKQRVDLAQVINQALETSQPLADREQQTIKLHLPKEPIKLEVDAVRLAQVFSNLLNNACKFSLPNSEIVVTATRQGAQAEITVQDDGLGIPPENLERVFEMFTQLLPIGRSRGGLGIGLSLARRLVEMHGGTIRARSDGPNRGSQFIVKLPIAAASNANLPTLDPSISTEMSHLKVLVVDDNRDAAITLQMLMSIHGHEAIMAHDGGEACRVAESYRPNVILLDIGLPTMNGYEACRTIRQSPWGKQMTIIALTGWGKDEDRRQSEEAGFDGHLVKPVNNDTLMATLSTAMATQSGG